MQAMMPVDPMREVKAPCNYQADSEKCESGESRSRTDEHLQDRGQSGADANPRDAAEVRNEPIDCPTTPQLVV